jgi:hypothetical protein
MRGAMRIAFLTMIEMSSHFGHGSSVKLCCAAKNLHLPVKKQSRSNPSSEAGIEILSGRLSAFRNKAFLRFKSIISCSKAYKSVFSVPIHI